LVLDWILLRNTLDGTHGTRVELRHTFFIDVLAEALVATGRVSEAVNAVQRVLDDSLQNDAHWCVPEFLRLRGEVKLRENSENAASAENDFEGAIALSARQGARSWAIARSFKPRTFAVEAAPIRGGARGARTRL
jgi:hypothetical protein